MPAAVTLMLAAQDVNWVAFTLNAALVPVLVLLSGWYSGSEPVLFSLTRLHIEHNARSGNPLRRIAAGLMQRPQRTLAVILLGNTAVNVLLYANTYLLFAQLGPALGVWAKILPAVFSLLVVSICCEAIPKALGVRLADRLAPYSAALIHFSGYVLRPAYRVLDLLLIEPLNRLLWGRVGVAEGRPPEISTFELQTLLDMSRRQGVINPVENAFLREVIHLRDLRVRDVMTPRVEVVAYDVNAPAEGLRELMRATRRKKVPVYEGTVDQIIGLVYAKMLFLEPQRSLRQLLMPVRFVPELSTCEQLLHHFRQTRTQLAIAVDEYGGMAGLVTLEDVLESIVGDLPSPDQPEEPEIVQLAEDEYDVSGRLSVHYWPQLFGLPRLTEGVATVGGLVIARLGRPGRPGDVVQLGNMELRVTRLKGRRVDRVRIRLLPPEETRPDAGAAEAETATLPPGAGREERP
ncbi:MAG: hemolysin family protein [Planctomycetota bacterium]